VSESLHADVVRPENERLTMKVWETQLGLWAYGIYTGDGTKPGSLRAAAGGMDDARTAIGQGLLDLQRQFKIRDCAHDWEPWHASPTVDFCPQCGIVKGVSIGE
jgi:hypothetical protein